MKKRYSYDKLSIIVDCPDNPNDPIPYELMEFLKKVEIIKKSQIVKN